jgi:hypothetical protein
MNSHMTHTLRSSPRRPIETAIDPREQVAYYDPRLSTDIGATALPAP